MATKLTWAFIDDAEDKAYKGATVSATVTAAQLLTFATVLEGYSDAALCQYSVSSVVDVVDPTPSGTKRIENSGTLLLKDSATGQRWALTIPGISETAIEKNGTAPAKLTSACEAAVQAAFVTMTALATVVYVRSFIQEASR